MSEEVMQDYPTSPSWPIYASSARLIIIICFIFLNIGAAWKVTNRPKVPDSRQINRLSVISILVVNLSYLVMVWIPFSIGSFHHDIFHHGQRMALDTKDIMIENQRMVTATVEELPIPSPSNQTLNRVRRWAKIESAEEHKGTWAVVFPAAPPSSPPSSIDNSKDDQKEPLPIFFNVDCGFQDCVTSSCCYSLAFIAIVNLILTHKPLLLPMGGLAMAGYTAMLTGVPFLATSAIRYAEQVGSKYAPHAPLRSSCGYKIYNFICDVHISDSYVFLSFLEWAGLMMVLLLTVTSFLGVASKTTLHPQYSNQLNKQPISSFSGKLCSLGGHYTRDCILAFGAAWSWPFKPCCILLAYVTYGKYWTNNISWISHCLLTASVVFVSLATIMSADTFTDEENKEKLEKSKSSSTDGTVQKVTILSPTVHSLPPSYEEYSSRYSRQINEDEPELVAPSQSIATKCAKEIKNSLQRNYISETNVPSNKTKQDTKIILDHMEEDSPSSSSDV